MKTSTMRVTETVRDEVTRMSQLCGDQPAVLLERAWNEYLINHREQFAADLEAAAQLVRNGSTDDLVAFVQDAHHTVVIDENDLGGPADERTVRLFEKAAASLAETRSSGRLVER